MNGIFKKCLIVLIPLLAVQCILRFYFNFTGIIELSTILIFVAPSIFIIGFILNSAMADYKESEKIPGNIIGAIDAIGDAYLLANPNNYQNMIIIKNSLYCRIKNAFIQQYFNSMPKRIKEVQDLYTLSTETPMPIQIKYRQEYLNLIAIMRRVNTIKTTRNLPAAYTLLKTLIGGILVMLCLSVFKTNYELFAISTVIPLLFIYLYHLIADIDDPFEYDKDLNKAGEAEIDLSEFKREYTEIRNIVLSFEYETKVYPIKQTASE